MKSVVLTGVLLSMVVAGAAPVAADEVPAPAVLPAPTNVTGMQSGTSLIVSWEPSAGATSYTVSADPSGQTCTSATTTCVFDALPARARYSFTVTATDGVTVSDPSSPSPTIRLRALLAEPIFPTAKVLVGRSAQGRKIWALRQGNPLAVTVLLSVGQMHGSEPAGLRVTDRVRNAPIPDDADYQLWTIRTMNPDGAARGDRYNARGVDLNRNFPGTWSARQYRSGRAAGSEPETRVMMRFIQRLQPTGTLSFHQPWNTVLSVCDQRSAFWVRRAAVLIGLKQPGRPSNCGSWYPGTMSRWTARNTGSWFVTVELAPNGRVGPQIPRAARAVVKVAEEMAEDSGPAMGLGTN
ncbi:MAG: succinylglutamate desuccinylase/aspartoacylase family protein [Candidatus Nanopelagicales bacterium]|nr:succinylglutamate desuccinylase/aspartoacylase family protein [Candidatus Nanopelagicales bacterium]